MNGDTPLYKPGRSGALDGLHMGPLTFKEIAWALFKLLQPWLLASRAAFWPHRWKQRKLSRAPE